MNKMELDNPNPFDQEKVKEDGKDVFIITRYFTGTKTLEMIFEQILENHDNLKDKVS